MTNRLFFYGTLMSDGWRGSHFLDRHARLIGPGTIRGDLYIVAGGAFPAYVPGDGTVHGEVWEATDLPALLRVTDSIEGYRPHDLASSLYVRERVPLLDGSGDVFTYRWNRGTWDLTGRVESGSWREWSAGVTA